MAYAQYYERIMSRWGLMRLGISRCSGLRKRNCKVIHSINLHRSGNRTVEIGTNLVFHSLYTFLSLLVHRLPAICPGIYRKHGVATGALLQLLCRPLHSAASSLHAEVLSPALLRVPSGSRLNVEWNLPTMSRPNSGREVRTCL